MPLRWAAPNPSAVYCSALGYSYRIIDTPDGQFGRCVVDDLEFAAWDFFRGSVGQEHSYCAREGMDLEIKHIPLEAKCKQCKMTFEFDIYKPACSQCDSTEFDFEPDAPLLLETIEFEENE